MNDPRSTSGAPMDDAGPVPDGAPVPPRTAGEADQDTPDGGTLGGLLTAYADGALDEAGCREVEARLAADPALREVLAGLADVQGRLRATLPARPAPLALSTDRAEHIRRAVSPRRRIIRLGLQVGAVAASLLTVLGLGMAWGPAALPVTRGIDLADQNQRFTLVGDAQPAPVAAPAAALPPTLSAPQARGDAGAASDRADRQSGGRAELFAMAEARRLISSGAWGAGA